MSIKNLVRKNIIDLKPYTSARSSHLAGILMDANENPYTNIDQFGIALNRYPDPNHAEIKKQLSKIISVESENLFIGVGSDEIIDLLIRIFCIPGSDSALVFEPTYGMYKVACDVNNVEVLTSPLNGNFQIDLDSLNSTIKENTKIIFICNPNNPTANCIDRQTIINIAKSYNCIVVVDEAYIEFSNQESLIKDAMELENLVVTRTFSKAWGLASVRCGYAAASKEIIELLYKVKLPYNINKLTQSAILNAIENVRIKDEAVNKIILERENLISELKKISFVKNVYPSQTNYILFKVEEPKAIYNYLAAKGIIIRDRSSQIEGCLRVSVGTKEENIKFIETLAGAL